MIRRKLRRGRNRHFIADRTGTLHHSLQSKRGKGGGSSISPGKRISKSPIGTSDDIGREVHKGEPRDPRRVPSSKADGRMGGVGVEGKVQGALRERR
jgi:hypothetical protein